GIGPALAEAPAGVEPATGRRPRLAGGRLRGELSTATGITADTGFQGPAMPGLGCQCEFLPRVERDDQFDVDRDVQLLGIGFRNHPADRLCALAGEPRRDLMSGVLE